MEHGLIYLGVKGSVVAIDQENGKEQWRLHLKGSGFVTVVVEQAFVLAHTHGHLFCVDKKTGRLLWENGLSGLGYGYATIGLENADPNTAAAVSRMAQQAAATSAAHHHMQQSRSS